MSFPSLGATPMLPLHAGSAMLLPDWLRPPAAQPSAAGSGEGMSATGQGAASGSNPQLEQVSREFEALLLSFVFKAMRQTIPKSDFLGKARDRDWCTDLFDFELAKSFAPGKSVGLAAYLQQDLQRMQTRPEPQLHPVGLQPRSEQSPELLSSPPQTGRPAAPPYVPLSEAMSLPVIGRLSSHYGERSDPLSGEDRFHHGIDIAGPIGSEIRAALSGTVTFSGWQRGYGQTVILSHANGYTTQYAHNSENLVQMGDLVNRGQPIALIGQSGRATGPHVHFEVRKDGEAIDPIPLLAKNTTV